MSICQRVLRVSTGCRQQVLSRAAELPAAASFRGSGHCRGSRCLSAAPTPKSMARFRQHSDTAGSAPRKSDRSPPSDARRLRPDCSSDRPRACM